MVDAVIRERERLLNIRHVPFREIRTLVAMFCVDDELIASHDPRTLQTAVDLLTSLFDRVGLQTNTTKTEVMTFVPGKIRTSLSDTAYRERMDEDFCGKGKGRKVEWGECDTLLAVGLLAGHMAKQHGIYLPVVGVGGGPGRLAVSIAPVVEREVLPVRRVLPLPRAGLPARA